ncbi:hypothetical protein [Butyrivibrio sp. INlla14]|uniref:hypothetical protein n=1 Tax=Butyrivibrio sp. INlla14 TaxID=1520808 RepID=UPI0008762214|nr:hypothetical protein [Butyrivibrio sp. INlla14]SCY39593.1 hypothetical protein SAMN02910371_02116 [Butyrivibrio sp. INlla14]
MYHNCFIKAVDEEEITIEIDGVELVCFCNVGTTHVAGDKVKCELSLYDDYSVCECDDEECRLERVGKTYSYKIYGILDVDNRIFKSDIDFEIDDDSIYDISYLDGKMFGLLVQRIDIEIL